LSAPQVAALLNISRALAYRWMQDGTLPALRAPVGRVVRVPRAALEAWIKEHTRRAGEPAESGGRR
jgi:excisionase family DNA binding protein